MRLKVSSFHAKANANESARWHFWSRRAGLRSVGQWLEVLANREVKRREIEGGYRPSESETSDRC